MSIQKKAEGGPRRSNILCYFSKSSEPVVYFSTLPPLCSRSLFIFTKIWPSPVLACLLAYILAYILALLYCLFRRSALFVIPALISHASKNKKKEKKRKNRTIQTNKQTIMRLPLFSSTKGTVMCGCGGQSPKETNRVHPFLSGKKKIITEKFLLGSFLYRYSELCTGISPRLISFRNKLPVRNCLQHNWTTSFLSAC